MSLEVNIEPEEFNSSELHNCIQEIAKMKGMEDFEYQVDFACNKTENFVANIFRVLINDSGKSKNVSVIVKTLVNTTRQDLFQELHKREVFVYKEVLPKFKLLQENIDIDERVSLPECMFSSTEKDREILILEDLLVSGFAMDNKAANFKKLDYLQVRLVLTELAKFHALSFILQRKDPENFDKLTSELQDIVFQDTFLNKSKLRNYFSDSFAMSMKQIKDEDAKKKLAKVETKLLQVLRMFVEPKKYNVLCHGDCWINNILFKHQVMKQSKICFLDFQAMRYANPTTDIIYFLYLCTDAEFRSEYFETLQTVYYESLKSFLRLFDIDVRTVYPLENFKNDIEETLPFGLAMALVEMRIVTTTTEESTLQNYYYGPVTVEEAWDDRGSGSKLFSMRINDVVEESVNNGVLDKLVDAIN
uniref:CHK kinase-like domain-containing protein n=1 Tax=Pectinophora gossypiella TaxID=13191 RepID=A0A1E1WV54_PECGO